MLTATVKFDYDASEPNELTILAREVSERRDEPKHVFARRVSFQTVNIVREDDADDTLALHDSDWITIEKPHSKERGRVPRAYLRMDSFPSSS